MRDRHSRMRLPSPALVIACLALAVALGGTGYAAFKLPAGSVGTRELKKDVPTCYTEFGDDLIEKYGLLYAAFEEALVSKENFKKEWGGAPWAEAVYNVAKDNIVLAVVSIQGMLEITCFTSDGAIKISRALTDIEKDEDDVSVAVQYVGPPRYRLIVLAPDYKIAEDYMKEAVDNVTAALHKCKGTCTFTRKEA